MTPTLLLLRLRLLNLPRSLAEEPKVLEAYMKWRRGEIDADVLDEMLSRAAAER